MIGAAKHNFALPFEDLSPRAARAMQRGRRATAAPTKSAGDACAVAGVGGAAADSAADDDSCFSLRTFDPFEQVPSVLLAVGGAMGASTHGQTGVSDVTGATTAKAEDIDQLCESSVAFDELCGERSPALEVASPQRADQRCEW